MLVFSSVNFQTVFAEETLEETFEMDPVPNYYEYEKFKDEDVDLLDGETMEELIEQLDDDDVVALEESSAEEHGIQFRSFSIPEPRALTMGFLHPTGNDRMISHIYTSSTSSTAITYISDAVQYTGVIPFVDYKNGRYRVVVSGVDGWISEKNYRPYATNHNGLKVNHYTPNADGTFDHWISLGATNTGTGTSYGSIGNGTAPSFLTAGIDYFSSDGHYFYKDTVTMLNDYKNNTRENSINPNKPHYNYFQFISYRTKSSITASDLDGYIKNYWGYTSVPTSYGSMTSTQSMLVDTPKSFVEIGTLSGANPLISFSIAINESGRGRSIFAIDKKNLFGHSAYDSSSESATGYNSVVEGVEYHNQYFINNLYARTQGSIYHGAYLGNKANGINVKYASDPYWGEKAADNYGALNRRLGNKDTNKATIGVVNTSTNALNVRKEPYTNSSGVILYTIKVPNQAVDILSSVKGESINGSDIWYKISSDAMLDGNRNVITADPNASITSIYNYDKNYAYVHSSYIDVVAGKPVEGGPVVPNRGRKGDVNGDGKITLIDLASVKSHLLKNSTLSGDAFYRADVNDDGKITLIDLALIKSHLLGNSSID